MISTGSPEEELPGQSSRGGGVDRVARGDGAQVSRGGRAFFSKIRSVRGDNRRCLARSTEHEKNPCRCNAEGTSHFLPVSRKRENYASFKPRFGPLKSNTWRQEASENVKKIDTPCGEAARKQFLHFGLRGFKGPDRIVSAADSRHLVLCCPPDSRGGICSTLSF